MENEFRTLDNRELLRENGRLLADVDGPVADVIGSMGFRPRRDDDDNPSGEIAPVPGVGNGCESNGRRSLRLRCLGEDEYLDRIDPIVEKRLLLGGTASASEVDSNRSDNLLLRARSVSNGSPLVLPDPELA